MSSFRTLELSDPHFEPEGLRFLTVRSENLLGRGDMVLFVPEGQHRSLPLITLLHGVYGTSWAWSMLGGAHKTAARLIKEKRLPPCVIAMPSDGLHGDGTGYMKHASGRDYESWIVRDVPLAIRENIEQVDDASPEFIGGLSMGGFGALRLACRHPHQYRAVSAHSAALSLGALAPHCKEPFSLAPIEETGPLTVLETIQQSAIAHQGKLPHLRFDCGTSDDFIEDNRALHRELTKAKIPHEFEEFEGAHDWHYWSKHIEQSLLHFAGHMGSSKAHM